MRLAPSRPTPIGMDVGGRFVHAVQLQRAGRRWRVHAAVSVPRVRPDERLAAVEAARLSAVLHRQGFRGQEIVLTLSAEDFMSCEVELSGAASSAPLAETARTRLAAVYKCPPEAMEVACWVVPQAGPRAFAVGCAHAVANSLIDPFEDAGFVVRAVDVPSWAGVRACRPLLKGRGLEPIVNIGWAAAHIVVLCNGSVVHERSLPEYGLRQIRSSISEAFALEPDVADYILREYGVGADAEERDEAPDLADDVGVQAAGALSGLASELRESIAYTSREFAVSGVERLLVHGEGAAIRGLDRSLGEGLACEVVVVTPERVTAWDSMPEDLRRSPMLVTACGLGQHPGD